MEDILKCECGFHCTSEKVFWLHKNQCNNKVEDDKLNYIRLGWHELRKYAADKGVDISNKKKDEIILALQQLEG